MRTEIRGGRAGVGTRRGLPTVDVVVPCYNYAHFLRRCVASVLEQPGVDVRVLVVDDRSSDDTPLVVRELSADPRVHGRRHEVNRGHIATYNEGLLEWAEADCTVLLSADDLLAPGALARAATVLRDNPDVGLVYGRGVYYTDHDRLPRTLNVPLGTSVWSGREWIEGRCRSGHNVISSPEVVVRTSVQQRVGGYRPDLPHAGDLEMWLRFAAVSDVAHVRGRPAAYYRVHENSMLRTRFNTALVDLEQRRDVFARFFADHPGLPDAALMHTAAKRALAKEALWRVCRAYDRDDLAEHPHEEMTEFALSTYSGARRLPEHAALERRKRLGAEFCHRTQIFAGSQVVKRAENWLWWQSWKLRGV
ncbi:glycosyltransferase [Umezawaea beigongshangensis]|uniref:glycosyltransferase n=1 Tax=Umezawaea beigongshangensis TaxID=2780383 RepID=UPI0027DAD438|nr:glycosyltransferase [Umezawaea beigongshangensis]